VHLDDPRLSRDIDFLFEMGNIRLIDRVWKRLNSPGMANLSEHHFRVFWIAMVIAAREKAPVDTGKIAKIALMHDIDESRTGDVDILSRQYVKRDEDLAFSDILGDTSVQAEYLALWREYSERKTLEAKIVKDADNLDVDFELAEQAAQGSTLRFHKHEIREYVAENKLYTDTAKAMYAELKTTNPHNWWKTARNRRSSGDWSDAAPEVAKAPGV
jgi:putative hydrolase of HD superfamily